ncbi:hypothetical protein TNCV_2773621 [Trichonephila clavipes]|nr:hypothetical protein TNCV_2773621 [Trichonephila clavipes]
MLNNLLRVGASIPNMRSPVRFSCPTIFRVAGEENTSNEKGCMPKIPFPQLPKECLKNPLIEAMLRSWFMNGYYAGMYAANKNGGHAGERGS